MGDENYKTNGVDTNNVARSKGVKFFLTYFGLYLAVWVVVFIVSRVCNPKYFQDSLEVSYVILGFLLSIALAAVLGVIPAVILENSKKNGYVYFCVLGFLLINLLAFVLLGTALKVLCWIPVLYGIHFLLLLDALSFSGTMLTDTSSISDLLGLVIFPTLYYLLLVWISLRVTK